MKYELVSHRIYMFDSYQIAQTATVTALIRSEKYIREKIPNIWKVVFGAGYITLATVLDQRTRL
jgi:hypothetical protein